MCAMWGPARRYRDEDENVVAASKVARFDALVLARPRPVLGGGGGAAAGIVSSSCRACVRVMYCITP